MKPFESEEAITKTVVASSAFMRSLGHPGWAVWQRQEVDHLFGIPDLLIAFSSKRRVIRTYAFEMKRSDWKRAMVQAFRYASFAHYPCVVMDSCYVHRALPNLTKFRVSNIGLLSVSPDGRFHWHYRPTLNQPYDITLQERLENVIRTDLEQIHKETQSAQTISD